ncbi:helix-turn-helix domain-containing protein [Streptomyces sp. ISL-96]|uniref:helix-turn-helix domain-containing protein n=1 Tax=Streptomyces sp. ISL-96 TaxID=2819191 RepID=UPI001BE7A0A7|nr:helix-turn-helix transcriptional regulator [Streptomyces sp. ISL-96]MBT2488215.1 helix-turn-helix domain-containing protein [Streptomyces sp. ISL-96]
MPPRSNPTARHERLGAELRRMRERAGVTARAAAALLGSNPIQMSHVESGRSGISEDRIRRLAAHCACTNSAYIDALVGMASQRGTGWWEEYRGVVAPPGLDLAELEQHARRIRTVQVVHIPGLFQTEDHMRAAFRYVSPDWPEKDREAHVSFRTRRQEIITGEPATPVEAVVHEAALRIKVGGRKTARAQLERILELSDLAHVEVRVIPFETEDFAGAGHSMLYVSGPVPQLDTVQIDTAHGGVFLDAEPRLEQYRARFGKVVSTALGAEPSRDFINRIVHEM